MPWLAPAFPAYRPAKYPYLSIRPLTPGDTGTVQAVLDGMSPATRQLRFGAPWPRLPAPLVRHLAAADRDTHEVLVASVGGRPTGLVRWARSTPLATTAEVAIDVIDRMHGLGIGAALLYAAAQSATRAGIRTFTALCDERNERAWAWLQSLDGRRDPADPGIWQVSVEQILTRHADARHTG